MRALLAVGLLLAGCQAHSQPTATPTPAPIRQVSALARLEPAGKIVKVQVPAARQQDRVLEWYAREGESISQGQRLVRLDGAARAGQDVEVARARVRQAEARLQQVLAGPKFGEVERQTGEIRRIQAEIDRQQQMRLDEVRRWETDEQLTRRNYERFRSLYSQGACSALELEQRQLTWNTARRQLQQARNEQKRSDDTLRAQLQSARGELNRIQEVRPSDVAAARADIEAARAELNRARVALEECQVHSPQPGTLLRIHTKTGERIAAAGLCDLAGTQRMVAVAEVYQNDLARLKVGQVCRLTSPALPQPLKGKILSLGHQVQRQNIFAEQSGEQFDQRVVEVRVALDPPSNALAARWTNLQMQAVFQE